MTKSTFRLGVTVAILTAFAGGWFCGRKPTDGAAGFSPATEYDRARPIQRTGTARAAKPSAAMEPSVASASPKSQNVFGDIMKLNARRERELALETFGRSLSQTNLTEALRLAGEITDCLDREAFLAGVVETWSARDAGAALAYSLSQNFSARCRLVPIVVAETTRSNPEAALQMLTTLPTGEVHDKATEALFTTWSALDPTVAARQLGTVQAGPLRERILDAFGGEWAANDPPAALAWASSLDGADERSVALNSVLREYGRRFPADALKWAGDQQRGPNPLPGEMLGSLLAETGFASPKEAFNQGLTFGTHPRLTEALAAVTSYYAEDQPAALLENFRGLSGTQQQQVSASVLFALGAASAPVPGDWFNSLSDPAQQQQAVGAYVQGLNFRDSTLAKKWLQALPEGAIRDAALQSQAQANSAPSLNPTTP